MGAPLKSYEHYNLDVIILAIKAGGIYIVSRPNRTSGGENRRAFPVPAVCQNEKNITIPKNFPHTS